MMKKLVAVMVAISMAVVIGTPTSAFAKDKYKEKDAVITIQGPQTCCPAI